MYKPRRSKYFTLRCAGVVHKVTKKHVHATLYHLDNLPELEVSDSDEEEVEIPITAFCNDNAVSKDKLKEGFFFCLYIQEKNNKKKLILEERKFRPTNTKSYKAGVKRKMKMYCKVLHGDDWKEVWRGWEMNKV